MVTKTVLFYTASREDDVFEAKNREIILKNSGGLPIVSVSQKPLDFGKNICVGDVGNSYINEYRQIYIGLQQIDTEYFISAEADFLYPEDYFSFEPTGGNIYRSNNLWLTYSKGPAYRKKYSEGAQIAKTEFMREFLKGYLRKLPEWFDGRPTHEDPFFKSYMHSQKNLWRLPFEFFDTSPCLTFKTDRGVNRAAGVERDQLSYNLPYWGDLTKIREMYAS